MGTVTENKPPEATLGETGIGPPEAAGGPGFWEVNVSI